MSYPRMSVQSPERQLSWAVARGWVLAISLLLTLPVVGALGALTGPLQNGIAQQGVVSLELAGSLARQNAVLASWRTGAASARL